MNKVCKLSRTGNGLKERLVVKRVADAHAFLAKQYDNAWKVYDGELPAGTYAYAGGRWHNVRALDPSVLAHV